MTARRLWDILDDINEALVCAPAQENARFDVPNFCLLGCVLSCLLGVLAVGTEVLL